MRNIPVVSLLLLLCFSCSKEVELLDKTLKETCRSAYPDDKSIRLTNFGELTYKYAEINGEMLLTAQQYEETPLLKFFYEQGKLVKEEQYNLETNKLFMFKEFLYNKEGHLILIKTYESLSDGFKNTWRDVFKTDEKGRKIHHQCLVVDKNSAFQVVSAETYEWDDCNLIKRNIFDKNGNHGYTFSYFYDDKLNPFSLKSLTKISFYSLSANNIVTTTTKSLNNPNYTGFSFNTSNDLLENSFQYNEFNLPTERISNSNKVVNYLYELE